MITLDLAISAEEALGRISTIMDEYKPFYRFRYTGERLFLGRVEGRRFYAFKKLTGQNSFNPKLSGSVMATECGCQVKANIEMPAFVRIFGVFWFSGVVLFLLLGLLLFISHSYTNTLEPDMFMVVLVPLSMLVFGVFFAFFGIKSGKKYKEQLHDTFMELFEDCIRGE